jgi:Uma2 family endonuclease
MSIASTITTAEQLLKAGDIGRCELVRGELRMMSPSGYPHGRFTARLAKLLANFVDERRLGEIAGAETGFLTERDPDTVRAPDAAFVRAARLVNAPRRGYFPGAPDLAVEVLSPDDTATEVLAKTQEWLDAGATEVWLVDPEREVVTIHRAAAPMRTLGKTDVILSDDLLPDLKLPVRDIFER